VANVKSSWLSREILLFIIFFSLSALNLIFFNHIVLSVIAVILGLFLLIAVERVYSVTDKKYRIPVHSANVVITALAIFSISISFGRLLALLLVIKAALYLLRHAYYSVNSLEFIFSFIRVFLGILIPLGSIFFSNQHFSMLMIIFMLIGELIDRVEFYGEQHVDTPRQLAENF
jgi:DMSO reductase anchor subunit